MLDHVACLIHIPIRRRLLDHSKISRAEAQQMMEVYLGADPSEAFEHCRSTMDAHAKFAWLVDLYGKNLEISDHLDIDDL